MNIIVGVGLDLLAGTGGLEPHGRTNRWVELCVLRTCLVQQTEEELLALIGREGLLDLLLAVLLASIMMLVLPASVFCGALVRNAHLIDQFGHGQLFFHDFFLDNSILIGFCGQIEIRERGSRILFFVWCNRGLDAL